MPLASLCTIHAQPGFRCVITLTGRCFTGFAVKLGFPLKRHQKPCGAFLQVIRPIHHATKVDAAAQTKHVAGLVREHFQAPAQDRLCVILPSRLAVNGGVMPGKTVNSDASGQRGLAKDEIPGWVERSSLVMPGRQKASTGSLPLNQRSTSRPGSAAVPSWSWFGW